YRRSGAPADVAGEGVLRDGALHHGQDRLVDADVNDLSPPAVDVAVVERDERPQRAEGGGQRVADADPDPRRRPVRVAGDVAQPAHGLTDDTEPGPLAVRAGLAVARDADHDQLRVD